MKNVAIALCCLLFPLVAAGEGRPSWVKGFYAERQNSYVEVVSAADYTETDARNKAVQQIVARRSMATGQTVSVNMQDNNIIIGGSDMLTVKARIIDEYIEREKNLYRVYLLVQTAKNPEFEYESVLVTNKYKFSPRVFIPGMAQIHKGQKTRGALFITGEVAFIGGAVVMTILEKQNERDLLASTDYRNVDGYLGWGVAIKQIRTGFIAGAAALYLWNVIDGIAAKGKTHIVLGDSNLAFVPYADQQSTGLMLSVNF